MKRLIAGAIILLLTIMADAGYAQKQPEDLLKAGRRECDEATQARNDRETLTTKRFVVLTF